MKLLPLFLLLFFILLTHAQRRTTAKPSTEPDTPKPVSRGRGRSRFVASPEYSQITDSPSTTESTKKTVSSRKRVVENVEPKFPSRASVSTNTPKQTSPRKGDRSALIGETADKIFLNDNTDRKPVRPTSSISSPLGESIGRKAPAPLTQTIERKPFRVLNKRPKNSYEVQEVITDDSDSFRRSKKPRVLTETNFRATNFPKRAPENIELPKSAEKSTNPLIPKQTLSINNAVGSGNLDEEQPLDTTLKPELETLSESQTDALEVKEEVPKTAPVSSTAKPTEAPKISGNRRTGLRRISNKVQEAVTPAPTAIRVRTRNRPTQAPDFYFQSVSTSGPSSNFRRRVDNFFSEIEPRKGPSVFNADSASSETRARPGRKIDQEPEKISLDIPSRNRRVTTSTTPKSTTARNGKSTTINNGKATSIPTFRSRGGRYRPPIIDEAKLEVLPLFEEEPKLVSMRGSKKIDNLETKTKESNSVGYPKSRSEGKKRNRATNSNRADEDSRSRGKVVFIEKPIAKKEKNELKIGRRGPPAEFIETSATQKDSKITKPPDVTSRVAVSISVESRTESLKPPESNKTMVKESVTSEINEITSRRKVSRKKVIVKLNEHKNKADLAFRGTKKSEVKLERKGKESSGEIDDSDNYPEAFKALIKAKKEHKESSVPLFTSSSTLPPVTNVVTSSTPSTTTAYRTTTKEIDEIENEIKPKPSTIAPSLPRRNRSRYTTSTSTQRTLETSSERRQYLISTASTTPTPTTATRGTRYRTFPPRGSSSISKLEKNVSFKPRTSSENEVRRFSRTRSTKQPPASSIISTKIPKYTTTAKKVDRGKYRSDSTTSAPKYIPTIPSIPYVPTVPIVSSHRTSVEAPRSSKDDDLGLQVISIDEPRFALPSANLVNGEYNSSTANSVSVPLPLVNGATTEKSVSIIERIINSITAISTTSPATNTVKSTESTTESQSAILKLASKKTRQTDKTDDTKRQRNRTDTFTLTTENPTTIIEKILSSLNAIQATDNSGSAQDEQNTIPSEPKPLSKAISTGRSLTPQTNIAPSSIPTSSTTVTTLSTSSSTTPSTVPSKPVTMPTRLMSTVLTIGRTVETSTENTIASTITPGIIEASTYLPDMVTLELSTVVSTKPEGNSIPTFPTLSGLLNGKTLEAFNEIVNKTDNIDISPKSETVRVPKVDPTINPTTSRSTDSTSQVSSTETISTKVNSTTQDSVLLSNRILDDKATTTLKPIQGRRYTSTPATPTSTYFPSFFTTLFPALFEATRASPTRTRPEITRISAPPSVTETVSAVASTLRPTTVIPTTYTVRTRPTTTTTRRTTTTNLPTTTPTTTTRRTTTTTTTTTRPTTASTRPTTASTRRTTTTTRPTTTTTRRATTTSNLRLVTLTLPTIPAFTTTKRSITVTDFNTLDVTTPKALKIKELTKEQRENLKIIAQLEKEQAELLNQLSFLTNLGIGPRGAKAVGDRKSKTSSSTLAERIVALAVERGKTTTTIESTIPTTTFKPPNSIQDQLDAIETTKQPKKASSLEEVLKQLNLNEANIITTPTAPTTTKSEDAILNSILKEQGFLPSTPESLAGIFDETTIQPRPRSRNTTPRPGPLMRGLNWLLTALGPQPLPQPLPTRRPTTKPVKPKKPPVDQELLANSPTHVTPVVTSAPSKMANALSQEDIQKLIKQLEGIRKNPSKESLDLTQLKSIQNLINLDDEGVVIMTNGEHGTTSRRATTSATTINRQPTERQPRKLSTNPPVVAVSNNLDDFDFETTTSRVIRAPIGFRPVPGVDDGGSEPFVRSNLITAAVNVTRALSGFLGTALQTVSQGAASTFSSLFGGSSSLGSRLLGNAATGSSAG